MTKIMHFIELTLVKLTSHFKNLIGIIMTTFKLIRIDFEVLGQYGKATESRPSEPTKAKC